MLNATIAMDIWNAISNQFIDLDLLTTTYIERTVITSRANWTRKFGNIDLPPFGTSSFILLTNSSKGARKSIDGHLVD